MVPHDNQNRPCEAKEYKRQTYKGSLFWSKSSFERSTKYTQHVETGGLKQDVADQSPDQQQKKQ